MAVPSSRLPIDESSCLSSVNTFGDLSQFLRHAVADEDSRILSEAMAQLAAQAENVIAVLRQSRKRDDVAPLLVDMLTVLRDHRTLVVGLGLAWRGLYEYSVYLQTLNHFRVLLGQWLLEAEPRDDALVVSAEDFELIAWRMLGEGMLLIDMYEQWLQREEGAGGAAVGEQAPPTRRVHWWRKFRR